RRREEIGEGSWADAFDVFRSPSLPAIIGLGVVLLALFFLWLGAAMAIYDWTLGPEPPASIAGFVRDVFTTARGWAMIGIGCGVGFLFALIVLSISVVSFPLLLDREVGLGTADMTSLRAVGANPGPMALWGLIVAGLLVLGSIPALLGLIVVMPTLGHATWHLYRRAVAHCSERRFLPRGARSGWRSIRSSSPPRQSRAGRQSRRRSFLACRPPAARR